MTDINLSALEKLYGSEPFYQKGIADTSIFSWAELERLINLRPFVNHKRFHILNNRKYVWRNPGWSTDNGYPPSLLEQEIKRFVCYFNDCSKANRRINDLCSAIEQRTGSEVDAHVYFSLYYNDKDVEPYVHKDVSHNLIIQIDGETSFKVWGKERNSDIILDVIMQPGDVLYIPADYWHGALSLTRRLSLSIPMSQHRVELQEDRHWIQFE